MTGRQTPRFAVVVPVYNKVGYVARAIGSVLRQTWQDFELILVDDCSTDGSWEVVRTYADPRIRVFRRDAPGPGGYAARNLGIRRASAEWVAFLDADDEWNGGYLEAIDKVIRAHPGIELACSSWSMAEPDGSVKPNGFHREHCRRQSLVFDARTFLRSSTRRRPPICTSAVAVQKRTIIASGMFPDQRCVRGGDVDTWLRLMLRTGSAAWTRYMGAIYDRTVPGSVTKRTAGARGEPCVARTVRDYLDANSGSNLRHDLKRYSNYYRFFSLKRLATSGRLTMADLRGLYYEANPLSCVGFLLAALVPSRATNAIISAFKKARFVFGSRCEK